MFNFLTHTAITAISLLVIAQISDSFQVNSVFTAFIAGISIGVVNVLVRPLILLLTLPLTVLTLGLFRLVVNGVLLYAVAYMIDGFLIEDLFTAIWAAAAVSILCFLLDAVIRPA